jgi:ribonuclease VapC
MIRPLAVDTSAIVAILTEEPEAPALKAVLDAHPISHCSTVAFLETFMVLSSRMSQLDVVGLQDALQTLAIVQSPVDVQQSALAAEAFLRFGKGRHPAKLNLGDCFSYALAKSLNAPLLYKGGDFGQTDIVSAIATGTAP